MRASRVDDEIHAVVLNRRRLGWGLLAIAAVAAIAWGVLRAGPDGRTLRYGEHPQALADLRPAAGPGPHPAMLMIHGGAWQAGSRQEMAPYAEWLVQHGVTAVSIDYRLTLRGARWPDPRDDVVQAMWWLREHAAELGIDPQRIGVWGNSAGGHLGAWLATTEQLSAKGTSSRPRLLVAWGAPWDLSRGNDFEPAVRDAVDRLLAGADAKAASPLPRVDAKTAPVLLIHGPLDKTVAPVQSHLACAALQRAGVECRLLEPPGEEHDGLQDPANRRAVREALHRFVNTHLKR